MLAVALIILATLPSFAQSALSVSLAEPAVLESTLLNFPLKNDERQQRAQDLLTSAKCPEIAAVPLGKKPIPATIVCVWPGESSKAILVGAHFDKVKPGEGKIDNASGVVLLPFLMRALHSQPRRHTFVYAAFAEEEVGLLGSKALVKKGLPTKPAPEFLAALSAVVNIDSVGAGQTAIALSFSDKLLASAADQVARALKLPLRFINVDQVGQSDGASFRAKNIPTIEFHSLDQENFPILHSDRDTMAAFRASDYADTYRLLAFYLAQLDRSLDQ